MSIMGNGFCWNDRVKNTEPVVHKIPGTLYPKRKEKHDDWKYFNTVPRPKQMGLRYFLMGWEYWVSYVKTGYKVTIYDPNHCLIAVVDVPNMFGIYEYVKSVIKESSVIDGRNKI